MTEYVIISGGGERALLTSVRHGWTEFCEDHVAFMKRTPEVVLVSFETEDAARAYIREKGLNEFTRVVPKSEVMP